ncbi:CPBP family intramembrane metalloprotease [Pedobacter petrophilus]|uniref:CPBP family intramembrane metalloprotease n=1 Tax=Pedobacter petrophilus TaxID=1908241 RepID=A0A7K0G1Z3_9SPHI|nr:type II CAAX endopeptidase family protein [Pedobacter petrophilus]MRX77384.1 CPBP family intramembrane metalloprotease [Pedobacter petrophilus]
MKHILYFLFIWFLAGSIIGVFAMGIIALIDGITINEVLKSYTKNIYYIFDFQIVGFLVTVLVVLYFLHKEEQIGFWDIGLKIDSFKSLILGFVFGGLPVSLVALTLYLNHSIVFKLSIYKNHNILIYFFILILVALNEEILTRGYVLRYLLLKKNKYVALLLSSILFATFHIPNDDFALISFINIFLSGMFLGLFYIYFKNLWFSISAHFAWNFFEGPVLGSAVSGLKTDSILKQDLLGKDLFTGGKFGFEASIVCTIVLIIFIYLLYLFCEKNYKKNGNLQIESLETVLI